MYKLFRAASIGIACTLLASCASTNAVLTERTQLVEYYRVFSFDGSTAPRAKMIEAARTGIAMSGVTVTDARPIPPAQMPERPGRYQATDPLKTTQFAAFAGQAAGLLKSADCQGAVWTARTIRGLGDDSAVLYLCMWEYRGGYNLDVYGNYLVTEGGISVKRLGRALAQPLVGTFEQTLERLVNDVAREMQTASGVKVLFVEGYPEPTGESWWTQSRSITSSK